MRVCPRCGLTDPCPSVKQGDQYIHAACRTEDERLALRRKPFPMFKVNGRRNRTSKAIWPGDRRNEKGAIDEDDIINAIEPHPTPGIGPQPWHADALYFRHEEGLTVRECARMCGVSFGRMQRFLNPESKRRMKMKQAVRERHLRHTDPEYAQQSRDYHRRYSQAVRRRVAD